jgi:hypothetical protein
MLNFVRPRCLGDQPDFRKRYSVVIQKMEQKAQEQRARKRGDQGGRGGRGGRARSIRRPLMVLDDATSVLEAKIALQSLQEEVEGIVLRRGPEVRGNKGRSACI